MLFTDPLRTDMRAMIKDMFIVAKERNPKIRNIRVSVSEGNDGTWLAFRATDKHDNVLAKFDMLEEKEQED